MDESTEKAELIQVDLSTDSIIAGLFALLRETNPSAYNLFMNKNREGFFEQLQSKSSLNKLADQLLDTIQKRKTENAG